MNTNIELTKKRREQAEIKADRDEFEKLLITNMRFIASFGVCQCWRSGWIKICGKCLPRLKSQPVINTAYLTATEEQFDAKEKRKNPPPMVEHKTKGRKNNAPKVHPTPFAKH